MVLAPVKELTSGVCPACNAVNADNRKFCGECAESLRTVCLGCDIEMSVWDKICGECGGRQTELKQQATETAAAVTSALAKGDWNAVLALDPSNSEGLRLQAAAKKAVAAEKTAILARESLTNTLGMTFNNIPAGTFLMGTPVDGTDKHDDAAQHQVTITKAFYIQTTEVTQGQWNKLMGTQPWMGWFFSRYGTLIGQNQPTTNVFWSDAVLFCKILSEKEGKTYRLPTEAEWEYACRAGTETRWSFGDDEKVLGDYAWCTKNASVIGQNFAHQVELKKPNEFGLYDMHGNVCEWCHDYYEKDYYRQSPEKDPQGPASGKFRVLRGGSFLGSNMSTRSAYRDRGEEPGNNRGFRLVRELD
ncbi:MAG: SUMF1/EgtB/PvdO family nonheme iron enzyme [Planctomycetaceae bacterium]|nr:SUMF1/EgtB/PvdO family nonheme iron enzyme [Planctomycetaceae bacterium]